MWCRRRLATIAHLAYRGGLGAAVSGICPRRPSRPRPRLEHAVGDLLRAPRAETLWLLCLVGLRRRAAPDLGQGAPCPAASATLRAASRSKELGKRKLQNPDQTVATVSPNNGHNEVQIHLCKAVFWKINMKDISHA